MLKEGYKQKIVHIVKNSWGEIVCQIGDNWFYFNDLTAEELRKPQEVGYARIYDRILERCFPVPITGESRRNREGKESYADIKEKLGL